MRAVRFLGGILAPLVALISLTAAGAQIAPVGAREGTALLNVTANAPLAAPSRYIRETGHNLSGPFQAFYDANDGVALFGHPLTEQLAEDGLIVQYFERARLELHPDGTMTLALLGRLLTEGRTDQPFQPPPEVPSDRVLIAETGHTLGGAFQPFWEARNGVAVFGNPISEEFIEQLGGTPMLVQYFERARLEYQPIGNGGDGGVRIGALGTLYVQRVPQALREAARPIELLAEVRLPYAPNTPEGINIELAAAPFDGLVIHPGYSVSYLDTIGEVSARTGYQGGQAIVSGVVVDDNIGGGICTVSTALYRAAFDAGLEILSRRNHSLYIRSLQDDPGLDSAVFTPDLDLRWRNDTPYPITITSSAQEGALIIALWGVADGRKVDISAPEHSNRTEAPPPRWQFDATMVEGAMKWVARGGGGVTITRVRKVTTEAGQILHHDIVVSRYASWSGLVLHGAGVTPNSEPSN